MDDNKQSDNRFSGIIAGLILYSFFLISIFVANFSVLDFSNDVAKWGSVGDYFGGLLNPVFAFLSFIALLLALRYQSKQIKQTAIQLKQNEEALEQAIDAIKQNEKALTQNAEALKINNKELENSTDQLKLATQAHQAIEKTQKLQQFENLFTHMIGQLNLIYQDVEINSIKDFRTNLNSDCPYTELQILLKSDMKISRFFIYLYQILRYVDEIEFDYSTKKKYANLLRSSLDNDFLQILYINCTCSGYSDDYKKYNDLITKYEFLEHMNFIADMDLNYNLLLVSKFYDEKAFGDSEYFLHIQKSWVYKSIIGNKKYHDKKLFFRSQYIPYKFLENIEENVRLEFSHNMDEGIILYVHGKEIDKIPYHFTSQLLNE